MAMVASSAPAALSAPSSTALPRASSLKQCNAGSRICALRRPLHIPIRASPLSVRRPLYVCAAASSHGSSVEPAQPQTQGNAQNIWLSDVAVVRKKPYFLRSWAKTDILIATFLVAVHGLALLAPFTFSWQAFGAFVVSYIVTGLFGITLSYHRNLSHKSFTLPKWLEYTFAYCGVLAMQGDPMEWVSSHRFHHQYCDTEKDPHSPYEGFWYSHMGWLLDNKTTLERVGARGNVADMAKDPVYKFLAKTYPIHVIGAAALYYALGGLPFLVWGVALRAVWVYHITWFVNSASHVWGTQTWNTGDLSRNNWWVALLAFGEGWHNNHHAFEYSARHGLQWWEFDLTWYCILALQKLGLATKVKLPSKDHMERLSLKPS